MLQRRYVSFVRTGRFFAKRVSVSAPVLIFLAAAFVNAQTQKAQTVQTPALPETNAKKATTTTNSSANAPINSSNRTELGRWLEFDSISFSTRYHFIENSNRTKAANNDQYQVAIKGRFKFDKKGDYSLTAGVYTGNAFTSGWNNTGWGTGKRQTTLFVKQLYFQARPVKGLEIQFGGLPVTNGVSTEATGYDNDAFITGERLRLKYPKKLFFDEISITFAYVGDLNQPEFFKRLKRLGESNYHQFLVSRHIGKRANFSADYTFQAGLDTLRQAVKIKVPETKIFDSVEFENYQIVGDDPGYGFNLFGDKKLNNRFSVSGGVAHIDRKLLNGDRFPPGTRVHFTANAKLGYDLSLSAMFTQGIGTWPDVRNRTRLDIVLTYNLLDLLHRNKLF